MLTTEIRDITWEEIRTHLTGPRERIWSHLYTNGPATTSQIAAALEMNLLTVRPRVCELCAMGFLECTGREGREGIYAAVTVIEAKARHNEERREAQLDLKLP